MKHPVKHTIVIVLSLCILSLLAVVSIDRGLLAALLVISLTLVCVLFLYLFLDRGSKEKERARAREKVVQADLCQRITDLVEKEELFLDPDLTFERVRQEIGTNRSYLSMAINDGFGMNFRTYLATLRAKYAKHLLEENPSMKIMHLYKQCGYKTQASLDIWFKTMYGKTPQEYALEVQSRAISRKDPSSSEEQER